MAVVLKTLMSDNDTVSPDVSGRILVKLWLFYQMLLFLFTIFHILVLQLASPSSNGGRDGYGRAIEAASLLH